MAIFEEESNASQDGNYREHLNRNWHNGNTEFADLRRLIDGFYSSIASLWDAITGWTQQLNDLRQKHIQDINLLKEQHNNDIDLLKRQHNEDVDLLKRQHKQDVDALTKEINSLNETIKKQDARISKLEDAVFGYGEYEVNYETPPKTIEHILEINTDSNPKLKGE